MRHHGLTDTKEAMILLKLRATYREHIDNRQHIDIHIEVLMTTQCGV